MIYTSYFARISKIKEKYPDYKIVSISHSRPKWVDSNIVEDWGILGPTSDLLSRYRKGLVSEKEYTEEYLEYISSIWDNVKDRFRTDSNIVMLCYEANGKFCHRHVLSMYLNSREVDCKELEF